MDTPKKQELSYAFGRFVIDPEERTLFENGVAIHLPAKEFDTLLMLVENHGRALSKKEMMAALWQDSFVEEGNLAKQISRLRKLLNSDGEQYIETIPKHGYRFNADVVAIENDASDFREEDSSERSMVPPPVEPQRWPLWYLPLLVITVAAIAAAAFMLLPERDPNPAANGASIGSVAILPFKAVGSAGEDEGLRLGLTDALVTKLGSLRNIVVRPTNATRQFGDREPVAAGRELRVDAVVDGNVQRTGEQLRVTVQLISVSDGRVLWGGKFDEKFTDIFNVQDKIGEQVARALELELTGDDRRMLARRYTTNPEAHYSYVRGRFAWNKRTVKDLNEALAHFKDAILKDPNYALAHSGLADTYSLLADYRGGPPAELYSRAKEAAQKALSLDDTLAETHTSMAYVEMYGSWNWQAAESGYLWAIELNPNYATAYQWYSEYLSAMGRFDDALAAIRRAKEIDPLSSVINAGEVWILYYARRYDEAIEHGHRLTEMNPAFTEVYEYLKRCYDQKGMYREAIAARQMRRKLAGADAAETPTLRRAANAVSHQDYWRARLEQEIEDAKSEPPALFDMTEIYAQLGERDKAFEWLEKAFAERNYLIMYLRVAPNLDPLRSDPRFADMLRRVGLGE